jgi:hypothetical protein
MNSFRDLLQSRIAEHPRAHLLQTMLALAVPMRIDELRDQGGPNWGHLLFAHMFGHEIAHRGDVLMFGGHGSGGVMVEGKGSAARLFNHVAKALAIMAFFPGGVTFLGDHWEAEMPKGKAEEKEPETPEEIAEYLVQHANGRTELIDFVAAAIRNERMKVPITDYSAAIAGRTE